MHHDLAASASELHDFPSDRMVTRPTNIANDDKLTNEMDKDDSKVISPISPAHTVFRTCNMKSMLSVSDTSPGATSSCADDTIIFLRYDEEHPRVAIVVMPETTTPRNSDAAGREHVALIFRSLDDLLTAYRQHKAHDVVPFWCENHGAATSISSRDLDSNKKETQVDTFESLDEADVFTTSSHFCR